MCPATCTLGCFAADDTNLACAALEWSTNGTLKAKVDGSKTRKYVVWCCLVARAGAGALC